MRQRKMPIYIRKPPPLCSVCGIPMIVTHTRVDHRRFRCPNPACDHTTKQERDTLREIFRPGSC